MSYNNFTINVSSSDGGAFWGVNVSEGRGVFISDSNSDRLLDVDAQAETIDEYSGVTGQDGGAKSVEITGDGRVVLVPADTSDIITYDLSSSTFTTVTSHTESANSNAFLGAALADNGKVIFAPTDSDNVGIYDPSDDTYTSGASHGEGSTAFLGATKLNDGRILFAPFQASNVGLYDPSSDTYTSGPSVSNTPTWQAVTMRNGDAILLPRDGGSLVVFDPSDDTVSQGASLPNETFRSIVASSEDRAYCFPSTDNNISDFYVYIYDNVNDSLTKGPPPPVDIWGRRSAIDLGNEDPRILTTAANSGNNFMGVDYGFDPNQQQHTHTLETLGQNILISRSPNPLQHSHTLELSGQTITQSVSPPDLQHTHTLSGTDFDLIITLSLGALQHDKTFAAADKTIAFSFRPREASHPHTLNGTFITIGNRTALVVRDVQHNHDMEPITYTPTWNQGVGEVASGHTLGTTEIDVVIYALSPDELQHVHGLGDGSSHLFSDVQEVILSVEETA